MGIYLILVGLKDQLFFSHLLPDVLHSKHILCLAAGLFHYNSIVVTYSLDTVHLYSLYMVTKDWIRVKSEVKTLISRLCASVFIHVSVLFVLMNLTEYWVWGSYVDFGHACSLVLANELRFSRKFPLGYFCLTYTIKQCLDIFLIKSFCSELDESSAKAQLNDAMRQSREKAKLKVKLQFIAHGFAYLPILICILCTLFKVNFATVTSLHLAYTLHVRAWVCAVGIVGKYLKRLMKFIKNAK